MHLKAILIKERLLGVDDYEVALSVGHLASLYNYDMQKYDDAERLYLRSIAIGQCVRRVYTAKQLNLFVISTSLLVWLYVTW